MNMQELHQSHMQDLARVLGIEISSGEMKALLDAQVARMRRHHMNRVFAECMQAGRLDLIEMLVETGADPNAPDENGATPLHWAALVESPHTVEALIEAGASIYAEDKKGETPFDYAQWRSSRETASALAKARKVLESRTSNEPDDIPKEELTKVIELHSAIRSKIPDEVEALIEGGANIYVKDYVGHNAFAVAVSSDRWDLIGMLVAKGADPDGKMFDGKPPVVYAAETGDVLTLNALFNAGANLDAEDRHGRTAMTIAEMLMKRADKPRKTRGDWIDYYQAEEFRNHLEELKRKTAALGDTRAHREELKEGPPQTSKTWAWEPKPIIRHRREA